MEWCVVGLWIGRLQYIFIFNESMLMFCLHFFRSRLGCQILVRDDMEGMTVSLFFGSSCFHCRLYMSAFERL